MSDPERIFVLLVYIILLAFVSTLAQFYVHWKDVKNHEIYPALMLAWGSANVGAAVLALMLLIL